MNYLLGADIFQTLGLSWEKILLFLANFAVLFIGLTFLLYKPIKKFMEKRKQEIADECASAEKIKAEAEQIKNEGIALSEQAQVDLKKQLEILKEEKERALKENDALLAEAKKEANLIIQKAEEESKEEKKQAVIGAKAEIADIALSVAKEILEREISEKDNEKLIDDCIKEWTEND